MAFRVCDGLTVKELWELVAVWLCFEGEKKKKKATVFPELFWNTPEVKKKCVLVLRGLMPDWMFWRWEK